MSEFKVGDSVRLKEGLELNKQYGLWFLIPEMHFNGDRLIKAIEDDESIIIEGDLDEWCYTPEMLILVKDAPISLSEIINRNYKASVKREKIDQFTNQIDFIDKIKEEIEELRESYYSYHFDHLNGEFDHKKLADIALVCFAMAKHYDIDLLKVMEEKTLYNETREG